MRATYRSNHWTPQYPETDAACMAARVARDVPGVGTFLTASIVHALNADAPALPREGDSVEFTQDDIERVAAAIREADAAREAAEAAAPQATCRRCGRRFPARQAMMGNRGTVCPDCYR